MAGNGLSSADREPFLAQPHVAALSVAAGPDRGPFTVPIWYQYAPGGEAWVLTGASSRKARLIAAAGRFSLPADQVPGYLEFARTLGERHGTGGGADRVPGGR
jgi:nitroimidazol reductase NimA-like FMN-containing flavoprotein (pyridoxamine 5'-phosphate oxidase superfamily)